MNSLLPALVNHEDLMTSLSHASGDLTAYTRNSLFARIARCQQQGLKALIELEAWCAEEEGLTDAFLDSDRTSYFQQRSPAVFERYALGLEDGRALLRIAGVDRQLQMSGSRIVSPHLEASVVD